MIGSNLVCHKFLLLSALLNVDVRQAQRNFPSAVECEKSQTLHTSSCTVKLEHQSDNEQNTLFGGGGLIMNLLLHFIPFEGNCCIAYIVFTPCESTKVWIKNMIHAKKQKKQKVYLWWYEELWRCPSFKANQEHFKKSKSLNSLIESKSKILNILKICPLMMIKYSRHALRHTSCPLMRLKGHFNSLISLNMNDKVCDGDKEKQVFGCLIIKTKVWVRQLEDYFEYWEYYALYCTLWWCNDLRQILQWSLTLMRSESPHHIFDILYLYYIESIVITSLPHSATCRAQHLPALLQRYPSKESFS